MRNYDHPEDVASWISHNITGERLPNNQAPNLTEQLAGNLGILALTA